MMNADLFLIALHDENIAVPPTSILRISVDGKSFLGNSEESYPESSLA